MDLMRKPVCPTTQAQLLRAKAESASGDDRAHYLWLADEWQKTAARLARPRAAQSYPIAPAPDDGIDL